MVTYDDGSSSAMPQTKCLVTTHDESGKAVFYGERESEDVRMKRIGQAAFNVLFTTKTFPADFEGNKDLNDHFNTKGIVPISIPGGTVLRMVDVAPGTVSPIHRTKSLDYGVVLSGEVELILEDLEKGPVKLMKVGDVSVQRATMHAWRNPSKTEWARMLYVLVDAKSFGVEHEEDLGGIDLPAQ